VNRGVKMGKFLYAGFPRIQVKVLASGLAPAILGVQSVGLSHDVHGRRCPGTISAGRGTQVEREKMKKAVLAGAAALAMSAAAPTVLAQYQYNAALGGGNTFFYPGTGNTNQNFAINTVDVNGQSIELAIKAKKRQGADSATPSYAPGSYSVQPGSQIGNANRWWWNWDFSLDLRALDIDTLRVDFVIGFESANGNDDVLPTVVRTRSGQDIWNLDFGPGSTVVLPDGVDAWDGQDGLIQNSSNLAFSDVNPGLFDMNAVGTYTITINVYDEAGRTQAPIGAVTMQAVVIPLPGAAGMAIAGMGMIGLRRRR
jgi:hypothetical protein